jgi:hypothetical protein
VKPTAKDHWPEGYREWFVYFTGIQFARKHKDAARGILGMPLYEFVEGPNEIMIWAGPADSRCKCGAQKAFKRRRLGSSRRVNLGSNGAGLRAEEGHEKEVVK